MTTTTTTINTPSAPAWTMVEPDGKYHAVSKQGHAMSSSMLKKFRQCPYAYHQAITGQTAEKDSAAFRFGRAVHAIVLEGSETFNKRYAIGGPMNPKTGKCFAVGTKAHDEWLAENGYSRDVVINDDEADVLVTMANMVKRHPEASALLEFGWSERVVRTLYEGVMCQIRIDWLTMDQDGNHVIVDLKTTDDMSWFESDARKYGYPHQLAFYRDVYSVAGAELCQVLMVAVEKREPYRVGVWRLAEDVLDYYAAENKQTLAWYRKCLQDDVWPTGYEGVRDFGAPMNIRAEAIA